MIQYGPGYKQETDITIGEFKADIKEMLVTSEFVQKTSKNDKFQLQSVQHQAPWNLDRIDQIQGIDGDYHYHDSAGEGQTVYIIDSGVNVNHKDFGGRATFPVDFTFTGYYDSTGHGTNIAGIVGSATYGVAKKSSIISVKIVNDQNIGDYGNVLRALQYAVNDKQAKKLNTAIAVLSLIGPYNQVVNNAVAAAVSNGIQVVVPAGNQNQDSCNYSPSSASNAVTVGSTNANDQVEGYSNYGRCMNVFAPGSNIKSTGRDSFTQINTGTSMSGAHVAGVLLLHLSQNLQVPQELFKRATRNVIRMKDRQSPNTMLFSQ